VTQGWEEREQRGAGATPVGTAGARGERLEQESRLLAAPRVAQEASELERRLHVPWLELERLAQQMDRAGPVRATTQLAASLHESFEGLSGSPALDLESCESAPGLYVARKMLRSFPVEGECTILLALAQKRPGGGSKAEPRVEGLLRPGEQRCNPTVDVRIPGLDDENAAVAADRLVSPLLGCGTRGGFEDTAAVIVLACGQRHVDSTADPPGALRLGESICAVTSLTMES
jgi:hypothetical protein